VSIVLPGILVIGILLLATVQIFDTVLKTGADQGTSLREASAELSRRLRTAVSITSLSESQNAAGSDVTVVLKNSGAFSISQFSRMDVLVRYTTDPGALAIKRLSYVTGTPPANQWSLCSGSPLVCSISPDTYNPNILDSDESATLTLRLEPQVKAATALTVVVVTPNGVYDSSTITT